MAPHFTGRIDADDPLWRKDAVVAPLQVKMLGDSHQDVCYKFHYELDNRPDWIIIPLGGLCEVLSLRNEGCTAMKQPKILAFVMAGGEGSRLSPLTSDNSKPSLPFGSRYRIVDFVLSNLLNSGIQSIYMLVQYKSQSLIEHVRKAWVVSPMRNEEFVTVVPPQMMRGGDWFQGTADAVYQNINLIQLHNPDLVLVFGADHIYRMDLQQMVDFHREREADVTVAALPVPLAEASAFGVIDTDTPGRVREFQEKPANPPPMPSDPTRAYASMGNYLFDAKVLVKALKEANERGEHDFGQNVLPQAERNPSGVCLRLRHQQGAGDQVLRGAGLLARCRHAGRLLQRPSGFAGPDAALRYVQPAVADLFQ
jgi:dTDP-glucose pyrophosphorylase